MARMLGRLVTLCGCLLFMASFCFLPYLVVPYTSFSFTGFQLLFLGPQIPLPQYSPGVLQNNAFVWQFMVLLVLLVLVAVAGLWPDQRLAQVTAWTVIIGVGLTLFFSLCNLASNLVAGYDFANAHIDAQQAHGPEGAMGLLGIWLGLILALIGSVITLQSRD